METRSRPSRRRRLGHVGLLAFGLAAAGADPAPAEEDAAVGACRAAWSAGALGPFEHGAFRLLRGGAARLADVRLPEAGPAAARAAAVVAGLAGESAVIGAVGEPDRWDRVAASIRTGGRHPVDLAELLVAEGLAIVDAGPREALCRPELLALEDRARTAGRGAWAAPDAVLRAQDLSGLAAASGGFAVVSGRVVSVGVRRERTYLNFGRDWTRDFAVTIPRRSWGTLGARGVTAESLRGATVRVRGIVEMRRAPTLDVVAADMLEVVTPRRMPAATRGTHDRRDDP